MSELDPTAAAPSGDSATPPPVDADVEGDASQLQDPVVELAQSMLDMARHGDGARLLPLLDHGAPPDMRDSDGNSLLMLAAYHGHAALVGELAARGADVDLLNDRGQSPLAGAVFKGFEDVVDELLGAGADPDRGTPSARESAIYFGRQSLLGRFGPPDEADGERG